MSGFGVAKTIIDVRFIGIDNIFICFDPNALSCLFREFAALLNLNMFINWYYYFYLLWLSVIGLNYMQLLPNEIVSSNRTFFLWIIDQLIRVFMKISLELGSNRLFLVNRWEFFICKQVSWEHSFTCNTNSNKYMEFKIRSHTIWFVFTQSNC